MPIDRQRRKTVMARSIKLGHCICNPQQGCPCPIFKDHNVCPCAGERLPARPGSVPLTRCVRKAGCASKIGQADLKRMLSQLPPVTDPNVLLGVADGDDAGVYRLDDQHCLVQTVDVFTPCVDEAYLFGQIAAANSLSDIYAMGGRPLTALSIIGFPIDTLDGSVMEALLRGGMDKLQEAGCRLIGGHSLVDEEIKCGFAVTGLIDPHRLVRRDTARPGDVLVLTKPLGNGMISFAAQIGRATPECLQAAGAIMAVLNKDAAELMLEYQAHACTDITGFGLAGHAVEMARNSGVAIELDWSALPVFAAATECMAQEVLPGAIERNQEYAMAWVRVPDPASQKYLPILFDPQTSGGLLIALPERPARELVAALLARGHAATAIIGRVLAPSPNYPEGVLTAVHPPLRHLIGKSGLGAQRSAQAAAAPGAALEPIGTAPPGAAQSCCAEMDHSAGEISLPDLLQPVPTATVSATGNADMTAPDTGALFDRFLKAANGEGRINPRAKKLMAIALSVAQRCQPCLVNHLKSALAMGISRVEIDEAAWLGIAFAGSPAMVFYREVCRQLYA